VYDLVVSDIHATADELGDVDKLMAFVLATANVRDPDRVIFLGDLHHTFAVTNVKVMGFYRKWFKIFKEEGHDVFALVGNHDMPGTGAQTPHALLAYEDLITVVDKPLVQDGTIFLPYYAESVDFHQAIEQAWRTSTKLIYCHQEFNGVQYDNGFFAPHGADPTMVPVQTISGHIHTPQTLGKVWYPGAPRWRTISDANIRRHIHLVNTAQFDLTLSIPTGDVCKCIWSVRFIEGEVTPNQPIYNHKDEFRVHIEGSSDYVHGLRADTLRAWPTARIATVIKDKRIRVRESDGIDVAFNKYVKAFKAKNATPPEILVKKAAELFGRAA
jgi:DNA repair exonuclease SbcCD nuclease subunit